VVASVAGRPIDRGPLVALLDTTDAVVPRRWVLYAPCCGLAWRARPSPAAFRTDSLDDLGVRTVAVPARETVTQSEWGPFVVGEEPVESMAEDLPL
jgi:hypothetical protein